MSNTNKMGDNVKALALAASIALSPESLASKGSVHEQLDFVKADVQHTLEISKLHHDSKNQLSKISPFTIPKINGVQYAESGQISSDASNAKVYTANFIENYKSVKIPSNAKTANVGNAKLAVWKDNNGKLNVTVTKEDTTGGTDDFSFTTELDGETYYFYTTDDMQLVAEKKSSPSSTSSGGGGIDYSNNLATINSQLVDFKKKIEDIEKKGDSITTQDKREKYALNKKIIELKELQRAELIKKEDKTTEEVIKNKQEKREEVIKKEDKTTEDLIKKYDEKIAEKDRIIDKKFKILSSRFK